MSSLKMLVCLYLRHTALYIGALILGECFCLSTQLFND
uniref:Eukaryotic translation initiation factor 3 subunit 6 n=1 Tax=Arundo donax TaxID=35708 RepID=A0A0A8ZK31_ARUDO